MKTTRTEESSMIVTVTRAKGLPSFFLVAHDVDTAAMIERAIVDRNYMDIVATWNIRDEAPAWMTADVDAAQVATVPATESLCGDRNVYVIIPEGIAQVPTFRVLARDAEEAEDFAMTILGHDYPAGLRVQGQGPAPKWMSLAA